MLGKSRLLPLYHLLTFCLLVSCAYYNTFYNAQKDYEQAMRQKESSPAQKAPAALLEMCIERCGKVIKFHPRSKWTDDAIMLMGKCFYEKGEYEKARRKFEEIIIYYEKSPLRQEAYFMSGRAYLEQGNWRDAIGHFESGTKIEGKLREECALKVPQSHFRAEQYEEAARAAERFLTAYPKSRLKVEALLVLGDAQFELEKFEEAVETYDKLLTFKLDRELRFNAALKSGACHLKLNKVERALEILTRLRKTVLDVTEEAKLGLWIADCQRSVGMFQEALRTFREVTERAPRTLESQEAFYKMGLIYEEDLADLGKARESYDKVREMGSSSEYLEKALLKSSSIGRLTVYRESLVGGEESDLAKTQFLLAELYLVDLDEPEKAIEEYEKVITNFPESEYGPKAAFAIGWIHENITGDSLKAIRAYEAVISDYPGTPYAISSEEAIRDLTGSAESSRGTK